MFGPIRSNWESLNGVFSPIRSNWESLNGVFGPIRSNWESLNGVFGPIRSNCESLKVMNDEKQICKLVIFLRVDIVLLSQMWGRGS